MQQYTKPIVIWSWDVLQVEVNVHPRLQRGLPNASAYAGGLRLDATNDAHEANMLLNCLVSRRDAGGALIVWQWLSVAVCWLTIRH